MSEKSQLADRIMRRFGYPMVKVELDTSQVYDAIDYAKNRYIKWADGAATQEVWFTIALSATQYLYDMPSGVIDVLSYESTGISSGINTLFTVENYMYTRGLLDSLINSYEGYTIVSYHIAKDFLETLRRYTPDEYNFKYHRYTNQLEIQPPPPSGGSLTYYPRTVTDNCVTTSDTAITIDSPGWILIRSYMLQGSTLCGWEANDTYENFYESVQWIEDFAFAYCKRTLGMIRRKFGNFGSMGNQGISLDGDNLISEAEQEMETLKENLKLEEPEVGYGIYMW